MLGEGIIKGLAETARNFVGSYSSKERLTTVQYPEERLAPKEAARNFPFLVFDGDDAVKGLRCVACQICEKECPPKCIYIVKDTTKKPDYMGKMQFQPRVFDIDTSVCMSCQICVEVCPFDAIKMDTEFELSQVDRFTGLLLNKRLLAKPNEYYHKIHPTEATEVDTRLAAEKAKAEAKAKADAEAKAKAAANPLPTAAATTAAAAKPAVPPGPAPAAKPSAAPAAKTPPAAAPAVASPPKPAATPPAPTPTPAVSAKTAPIRATTPEGKAVPASAP